MKNCKVELSSLGDITQLPDSQKVFGALIYMFAELYGDKVASDFVKNILKREIHCEISNVVPYDYFPMPQNYMFDKLSTQGTEKSRKEQYVEVKKRKYIKKNELVKLFKKQIKVEEIFPYIKEDVRQLSRVSIDSCGNPALDNNPYSVPIVRLVEVDKLDGKDSEEITTQVRRFCFYLRTDNKDLLTMLDKAENENRIITLGKRSSQGLNLFQFKEITVEASAEDSDVYLNMGMLLPDQIQFSKSIIKLFTSERRPYEMPGGWEKSKKKSVISFIEEGSIIARESNVANMGKSIESPFNSARDIVFGNSYLYPLPKKEGV